MDMELLIDVASVVGKLKMYPYFDIVHYILMCLQVKEDLPAGSSGQTTHAQQFARRHPFACWFSSMMLCFSAGLLSSFLLGEPIIKPFLNHRDIATATIVWYIIFYSPFDLVFKIVRWMPVRLVISLFKEVQRAYKILDGVTHVAHLYPDAYFLMVLIGTIKGGGIPFTRFVGYQLVFGIHDSENRKMLMDMKAPASEFLRLSFTTKYCAAASAVFVAANLNLFPEGIPFSLVYLGVVFAFMNFRLAYMVFNIHDPLRPIENLVASICLGGMWDALRVATMTMRPSPAAAADAAAAAGGASGAPAAQGPAAGSAPAEGEGKKNK